MDHIMLTGNAMYMFGENISARVNIHGIKMVPVMTNVYFLKMTE